MKRRRGSKIAEIVKQRFKCLNKPDESVKKFSVKSSENAGNYYKSATGNSTCYLQPSTSNHQNTNEHDVQYNTNLLETSTSPYSAKPCDDVKRDNIFENYLQSARSILENDLYLTDCSDDYLPEKNECSASSSELSVGSVELPSCRPTSNAYKSKENKNEYLFESNLNTDRQNIYNKNLEGKTNNVSEQKKKKRKRRQAVPNEWKKNVRKNKRLKGEPYLSAKGFLMSGKTLKESNCKGRCIHQCNSKFTEDERLKIFSSYWDIDTVEQKRLYIVNLINREKAKTSKSKESRKKLMNLYFLQKPGATEKIRVCQKFFVATLNVSESFIKICFKKVIDCNVVIGDRRGKHAPHNKKPREVREHVRNHIKSFPRITIPRAQGNCKKEYLGGNLNLIKMHKLYKIKCENEQRESVELAYYRSVFNKDFNIGFHRPGRDVCGRCLNLDQMKTKGKKKKKTENEVHLKRINRARHHRDKAKSLAERGELRFAEFDLKTICVCPPSSSEPRRTVPVYNLTLLDYNKNRKHIHSFCWHDNIARKGAAEIGSCLYKYLKNKADGKPITFMSDTCASQCRNMYISSLLLYCIETLDIPEINHKYFEKGHSEMETDYIHSTIQHSIKNKEIHNPTRIYKIIRKALRKYSNNVHEMEVNDFIDIKYLKNILVKNAKVDCHGEPVNWLNIRWLQYRKENTNYIYFKYDLNETEFNKIEVIRRGKRPKTCGEIVLLKKYHGQMPVTIK